MGRFQKEKAKTKRSERWIGYEMKKRKISRCPLQSNIVFFDDIHLKYLNVCKVITNVPRSKSHQTFSLYHSGVLRLGI